MKSEFITYFITSVYIDASNKECVLENLDQLAYLDWQAREKRIKSLDRSKYNKMCVFMSIILNYHSLIRLSLNSCGWSYYRHSQTGLLYNTIMLINENLPTASDKISEFIVRWSKELFLELVVSLHCLGARTLCQIRTKAAASCRIHPLLLHS